MTRDVNVTKRETRWDLVIRRSAMAFGLLLLITLMVGLPFFNLGKEAPGWAQFYGSMLAIVGAAIFPYLHEWSVRRQRADSYRRLLRQLAGQQAYEIGNLISALEKGRDTSGASVGDYHFAGRHLIWSPHGEALRAVPIVELAPLHVMILSDLKLGAMFIESVVARLETWDYRGSRETADIERLMHFKSTAEISLEALESLNTR